MNEPPGARARVGLTGLTVAEHFRDAEGQDVLLFIDNIFRFTQVGLHCYILLSSCIFFLDDTVLTTCLCFCFFRPTQKCLLCLDVSRLLSDINLL